MHIWGGRRENSGGFWPVSLVESVDSGFNETFCSEKYDEGVGEMAPRMLTTLAEDLVLVLSTHMATRDCIELQFQGM